MINKLATNQVEIYWQHDSGNFYKVSEAAKNIYLILGFDKLAAQKAGNFISEAYQLADKAEIARKEKGEEYECKIYIKASDQLAKAENALGYINSTAKNQANWWRYFRHKNIVLAFANLFIQHVKPLGIKRFHKALLMTIVLTKVGLAHNKRDKVTAIREAEKYWRLLVAENTKGCPYLG